MRAVVLLETNQVLYLEVALEVGHVADIGTAKAVDRLVIVADGEHDGLRAAEQFQPAVLQAVGILKLVNQQVPESTLVMLANRLVVGEQFMRAQQQLGKVDRAFLLAELVIGRVVLGIATREFVVHLDLRRAPSFFLGVVDEVLHLPRRKALLVGMHRLHHPFDHRQLVLGVENGEGLRQAGIAMVGAQQPVAQAVKGACPHATQAHRHQRREARHHLARRLVGEGDPEHRVRTCVAGLDEPGNAGGQHPGLARACTCQYQCMLRRQGDGGELLGVQIFEKVGHVGGVWGPVTGRAGRRSGQAQAHDVRPTGTAKRFRRSSDDLRAGRTACHRRNPWLRAGRDPA